MRGPWTRPGATLPVVLLAAAAGSLAAQAEGPPLTVGGLVRTGFRLEPEESGRADAFELFDARLSLEGKVGVIFEYFLQGSFTGDPDGPPAETGGEEGGPTFELLDARLTLPVLPEAAVSLGQFKAPFGREALRERREIPFLERALATRALAPGRQVGVQLSGEAAEGRLGYAAGIFNGNGRTATNDNGAFLYAVRVQYNTVGPIEFYEELAVQVGGNVAFSRDAGVPLGPGLDGSLPAEGPAPGVDFEQFRGDRFLLGVDLHLAYRGWQVNGEYLRGWLDPEGPTGADPEEMTARGGYLEGAYGVWGTVEGVVRYDFFDPARGPGRDFLVLGLHVFPGFHAKFGAQYAVGLAGSPPGAGIADGQFVLLAQMSF